MGPQLIRLRLSLTDSDEGNLGCVGKGYVSNLGAFCDKADANSANSLIPSVPRYRTVFIGVIITIFLIHVPRAALLMQVHLQSGSP